MSLSFYYQYKSLLLFGSLNQLHVFQLNVHIVFEGEKEFHQNVKLWGVIDVKRSYVTMTATKIEITMRKAEPMQWASLELPAAKNQEKQKEDTAE